MRLFFLRHGQADRGAWDGPDFDRPLTPRGARRMEAEAATIAGLELGLDLILTSPLARARQTAEIVARRLGQTDRLELDDRLAFAFGPAVLAELLAEHADRRSLLLVGHEPGFSRTIAAVTGGGRVVCKKGSLARVDIHDAAPPAGALVWLLPPRLLAP